MLPSHLQVLLTAAVDGELTKAELRLVDRLLRDSQEARGFHTQLLADAQRIRRLPRAAPVDDMAANVMNLIHDRCLMPTPLPMPRRKQAFDIQRLLPWISIATAAGVVIVVSLFSYLYFAAAERQLAKQAEKIENADAQPALPVVAKQERPPPVDDRRVVAVDGPKKSPNSDPITIVEPKAKPHEPELVAVAPRVVGAGNVEGSQAPGESEPFRIVPYHLELLLPLKDLDDAYPKKRLREELKKGEVVHLDLFCKDSARGADLLQTAVKARGQQVLVDGAIRDRLKKAPKTKLLFYCESMTLEEIAKLLEQLGADDKKAETKKAGDGQFDNFVVVAFNAADLSDLAKLLGIPASQVKLPKAKTPIVDPSKPLESTTANQLAANLPKSPSRGNDKMTLVLPYDVRTHIPLNSKETKTFLDKRGERKNGTAPMMLVLRPLN